MHHEIKNFINKVNEKSSNNVMAFIDGNTSYVELSIRMFELGRLKKYLLKHNKKRAITNKWEKKDNEIKEKLTYEAAQIMVFLNMAHSFQVSFFKIIYRREQMEKTGELVTSVLPSGYMDLLKLVQFPDSTDRERYILFNRVRNSFFHSSLNRLVFLISEDFLNDFVLLTQEIQKINSGIFYLHKKDILQILSSDVKEMKEERKLSEKHERIYQ